MVQDTAALGRSLEMLQGGNEGGSTPGLQQIEVNKSNQLIEKPLFSVVMVASVDCAREHGVVIITTNGNKKL